ncbi:MAG: hypothetical protein IMF05_14440 [Proteobacteria bacterium]|nr:hypothetical protein [Pseudomonadota bacterium]
MNSAATVAVLSLGLILAACSGTASPGQAQACKSGLSQAYSEFERAKADGFGGAVAMTKAGSLLSAAKIQQQFEKYPNCIDKVQRARHYIRQARGGGG